MDGLVQPVPTLMTTLGPVDRVQECHVEEGVLYAVLS